MMDEHLFREREKHPESKTGYYVKYRLNYITPQNISGIEFLIKILQLKNYVL